MVDKKLVELRNKIKAKKPKFIRQDANHYSSLEKKWVKPKGMHSKMRMHIRGHRVSPSYGYSSPRAVRGLNRKGFKEVLVLRTSDLNSFDPKTEIVLIGHVGKKRKIDIIKYCVEKKYDITNVKNPIEFVKKVEDTMATNKKAKKIKEERKIKSKEESLKKAEKKKGIKKAEASDEETKPQDETKKGENSEKIKVLEKKQ